MSWIGKVLSAPARMRRTRGFGVHSPHAFNFVTQVWREGLPYYDYDDIDGLHHVVSLAQRLQPGSPAEMSRKEARRLFRVTNAFGPRHILQVGCHYGLATACMLLADTRSRVCLYEPALGTYPVVANVLQRFFDLVDCCDTLPLALDDYRASLGEGEKPFVLVNDVPQPADEEAVRDLLCQLSAGEAVILLLNPGGDAAMERLWQACRSAMTSGHTFSNGHLAVINATRRFPLQHFELV